MSHLLFFLFVGLLFMGLLLLWALNINRAASRSGEHGDLPVEEFERPSLILADRIFSSQDWDYVRREASYQVQQEFQRERKRIALLCLKQTRRDAVKLMKFHRRTIRHNIEVNPSVEIKLAVNYLAFLFLCAALQVLIRTRGPFRTRRIMGRAFGVANELWSVSERLTSGLNASGDRGVPS
jgi:hypothetical protein